MKVKTFSLSQEAEANEFIKTVVLTEGGLQVVDDKIVIFYADTKENYSEGFVATMLESLKRNLFHEQVRKVAGDAEYEYRKEKGTNRKGFDEAQDKQREIEDNIAMFEAKIASLESWTANNS